MQAQARAAGTRAHVPDHLYAPHSGGYYFTVRCVRTPRCKPSHNFAIGANARASARPSERRLRARNTSTLVKFAERKPVQRDGSVHPAGCTRHVPLAGSLARARFSPLRSALSRARAVQAPSPALQPERARGRLLIPELGCVTGSSVCTRRRLACALVQYRSACRPHAEHRRSLRYSSCRGASHAGHRSAAG